MGFFEHKIKQFPEILSWASQQDVDSLADLVTSNGRPKLFMGSGGSYSAAAFAELLSAERGIMSHGMTPYFYIKSGFNRVPSDVILLSASGGNNDIVRALDVAMQNANATVGAITLQSEGLLQRKFIEHGLPTLSSYNLPTGREGFLSTTTVLAFYLLLYRAYGYGGIDQLPAEITDRQRAEIDDFVERLKRISLDAMSSHEAYLHKLEGVDSFFILYSPASYPAALDLESKFSEGAIGNTQLADYRNFAHGRFNWFTQRPGQTGLICLQTPDDREMAEEIISKVPNYVPALGIYTNFKTQLAAIDLLIKGHYLCSALAARWGLDLSRPVVPEYGRELYKK